MGYLIFLFGAVVGNVLNIVIYRLPRKKSIISLRLSCPSCEHPISLYHNIPIINYIFLRGGCRNCGAKTPIKHPIIEVLTACLFLFFFNRYGISYEFLINISFICLIILISFIDLEFQIIPDVLSIGGLCAGFVLSFFRKPVFFYQDALYGILTGGGILLIIAAGYRLITKRVGVGGGDIKLLGMIGAFCGPKGVLFSLMAGSVIGTAIGIPLMLLKGKGTKYAIPFGPFLSLGVLLFFIAGDRFIYYLISLISKR